MRPQTRRRLAELGYTSYTAYCRSPHWMGIRKAYIAAGLPWACFICGTSERIALHHCCYDRIGAEDIRLDIVPLCKTHHRGVHSYMKAHRQRLEGAHVAYQQWIIHGRPKPKQRGDKRRKRRR